MDGVEDGMSNNASDDDVADGTAVSIFPGFNEGP